MFGEKETDRIGTKSQCRLWPLSKFDVSGALPATPGEASESLMLALSTLWNIPVLSTIGARVGDPRLSNRTRVPTAWPLKFKNLVTVTLDGDTWKLARALGTIMVRVETVRLS